MKQKIKLTKENDVTIHVDDVDVSKGVYARTDTGIVFLFLNENGRFFAKHPDDTCYGSYSSLREFILEINNAWTAYTIHDGLRIVTEKELSVEDITNTNNIGFVTNNGDKGHFAFTLNNSEENYVALAMSAFDFAHEHCNLQYGGYYTSIIEGVTYLSNCMLTEDIPKDIYSFTTRKELYAWLAE
jgi:hypothetical protein